MMKRLFFPCLLLIGSGLALAATPATPASSATAAPQRDKAQAAASSAVRQINWKDLMPAKWDPDKAFKGIDFSKLEDADPRAEALRLKMLELAKKAPVNPAINGQRVKLPGFLVPLEQHNGEVSEFLLVPYFGACIHTPPPPGNQIVHVRPKEPVKFRTMAAVWISGKLVVQSHDTAMGFSSYSMVADEVTRYQADGR